MKSALIIFSSFLVLTSILALFTSAQTPEQPAPPPPPAEKVPTEDQTSSDPCPKIGLKAPSQPVRDGVPVRLVASLTGGDKKVVPMFDWSVSAGAIRSGQGTMNIEVDTTGASAERAIHATVLLGGFSTECLSSETAVVQIAGPAQKTDEFGPISDDEMAARIKNVIASLTPNDQVHIFAYAGRTNVRGYASSTLRQIRAHALKSGITSELLTTIDGGYREEAAFEFWAVPLGAEPPKPTPTVSAREIIFPRPTNSVRRP
ncbi:hypothetical protein BH20ACI2_BH20ACI2_28590 [soil metagenome]